MIVTVRTDWGVVCKHVVAVLFYLQKDLLDLDNLTKVKASPRKKKESETLQMEQILKHLTHDELRHSYVICVLRIKVSGICSWRSICQICIRNRKSYT